MTHSRLNELMHAVLDGEATAAEARELDAVLARDAKAKDEFDELRSLFDGLAAVPQRFPPEGLVAAVTARLGELPAARTDADQLFAPSGVFGASSKDVRGGTPGNKAAVDRVFPLWAFFRGDTMSESTSGFSGKRKLLIGGGFAVAAVAVAVSTGLFPPSTDTAGTIVPADRYRAPQITADDVKLGGQAAAGATTPSGQAASGQALGVQGGATNGTGGNFNGTGGTLNGTGMNTSGGGMNTDGYRGEHQRRRHQYVGYRGEHQCRRHEYVGYRGEHQRGRHEYVGYRGEHQRGRHEYVGFRGEHQCRRHEYVGYRGEHQRA